MAGIASVGFRGRYKTAGMCEPGSLVNTHFSITTSSYSSWPRFSAARGTRLFGIPRISRSFARVCFCQVRNWSRFPTRFCRRDARTFLVGRARPAQRAVFKAKYLLTNGGFLRLAYQMRKLPSGFWMTDWLVT